MSFAHLHVYSAYSLLSSTVTIQNLVAVAKSKGFKEIALTDRNVMYGAISFYKECIKQGIKPIIGLTVDVISEIDDSKAYPLVLLAENETGYHHLLKISSVVQTKSQLGIPTKWLKHYSKGLFAITPGIEGEIENYIVNDDLEKAIQVINTYTQIFDSNHFFLALQDHQLPAEKKVQQTFMELNKRTGIEQVVTNHVSYLYKEESFTQKCLNAIQNGEKLENINKIELENDEFYLKDAKEMVEQFSHFPDALENTIRVARACHITIEINQMNLPKYPTENGITAEELLENICWEGFYKRYSNPTEEHVQRLQYELSIITKMNFCDYFLIVWDFMKYSRETSILTGPGRGSAAGSMAAYVLYITDVDPICYQLLFERFLNPERITMPDIDIDFPDHKRDQVIRYVAEKYGELHVAQIITFGTFGAKQALRDVGRVFGLNTKELDKLSKLIPTKLGITLEEAYRESKALKAFVQESPIQQKLFKTALQLEGLPRHHSIHAAGIVISQEPLVNIIPIQSSHGQMYVTQYSMGHLEELGLLKMDFLGLRNLSLMESIISSISHTTKKKLDIKAISLEDNATYELLCRGETTGIFQLESEGMQSVLKRLKPSSFEDIVAVNALYRPGPMENIPLFIDRKHGRQEIHYPHPDLKPILENTYGVIVYQEQIMQIAASMAGFSLGEADLLRRAVSKKQKDVLDKERMHFVRGAGLRGYEEKTADQIYDLIVRFAHYGFNRSHAVAYSLIAYQLAYLKTHYPLHFMAALLSSVVGNEGKVAQYIREVNQKNFEVLPPSINKSSYTFLVEKNAIRYSLGAIKGIGKSVLKEIFKARKIRKFDDLFDFCLRVSLKIVNRKVLEALVYSGSFDDFGEDRAVLLASLDVAIEHAQLVKPNDLEQADLFSDDDFFIKPKYAEADPIHSVQKLAKEKEVLGLYLSAHPVSIFNGILSSLKVKSLIDILPNDPRSSAVVYLTDVKSIRTKKGDPMSFLMLSDQSDEMEAVAFPNVYRKFSSFFVQGNILLVEGKVEERDGKKQFIIQNVKDLNDIADKEKYFQDPRILYLKLTEEKETEDRMMQLREIFKLYSGSTFVILHYVRSQRTIRLSEFDRVNPTEECLNKLKIVLGENNVILK
ncbi:DNA polymerase III subunit alpha [Bacillus sp. 03113]|uniref:DNA polymerase III subunit alpha n=1 Tax=Bacillus sp. 03113 TaxID=2578211 RepID=UPI0011411A65|nr:DNA polymerase III subunit alpha [Bacillus sp. 03113]